MNKLGYIAMFAVGAVTGSAVTWHLLKTKYEQIAQDEIDSVKEMLLGKKMDKNNHKDDESRPLDYNERKNGLNEAKGIIINNDYTGHFDKEKKEDELMNPNEPYVIPPEEFGDYSDYEQICLTLYADGVLADEDDNIIEDIAGTVGPYYEDHFGEYEDDSVFVRNDVTRCEYEILKVEDRYSDATSQKYSMVANKDFD